MNTATAPPPPTDTLLNLLKQADEQQLRNKLAELAGEEAAVRTLLRSVSARKRRRATPTTPNTTTR